MKLKQLPEDFFVEELTTVQAGTEGDFALYRLEKTGWTTPDALQVIRRRWKIDFRRMSYGGLKDRHAHTIQFLAIWRGPERRLTHQGLQLEYLGRVKEPYTSKSFSRNRFRIVVRSLSASDIASAEIALEEIRRSGVPNYFDDQRFGSVSGGEYVAKAMVLGDFEQALRLALASPYEYDRAAQKREKVVLNAHWGDWVACKAKLERGHARSLVDYLCHHPGDFKGAVARLRPELRGLYLSAYQSHLWNRMLARWLRDHFRSDQLVDVELRTGTVPMHRQLEEAQRQELTALELPLPTARGDLSADDSRSALMDAILAEDGLTRSQLKVKGLRELFFSRGQRAALSMPAELEYEIGEDECNKGRKKVAMAFELPRGSYATLMVKRAFNT
jgi:tRNA pseudouridine13 synthase